MAIALTSPARRRAAARVLARILVAGVVCAGNGMLACSSSSTVGANTSGTSGSSQTVDSSTSGTGGSATVGLCASSGYACLVQTCAGSSTGTRLSGRVYDPAGKNPVYGAIVYIPDQPDQVEDLTQGPGDVCGKCVQPSGSSVAGSVSAADGAFTLTQVPVGRQIPLVVQLGKWRRMTYVDITTACGDNPLTDPDLTRLPRNKADGKKVSLPKIAIAAGAEDRPQCLLRRMGVDDSEFTNPDGQGAINIYNQPSALGPDPSGRYDSGVNSGASFPDATAFWSDINQLDKYDMVLLACGGNQTATDPTKTIPNPITDTAKASMVKYLSSGGRVLAEHFNWAWIKSYTSKSSGQAATTVASPLGVDVASWYPYVDASDSAASAVTAGNTTQALVDTSLPKGSAFAGWLLASGATTVQGTLPLVGDLKRTAMDELATSPSAQRWLYQAASDSDPTGAAAYTHLMSFNLTSSGEVVDRRSADTSNLCGRLIYSGLHVDSGDTSTHRSDLADDASKLAPFPSCCAVGDLNPSEKALEYMLLDLSSCLTLDAQTTASTIIF